MSEPLDLDATGQAQLVQDGSISALELVDGAVARIEKLNGELNAVIHRRFDQAREEASRFAPRDDHLFAGVPFVHKDLDGYTAGDPYYAGSRLLRDLDFRPDHDSFLAAELKVSGMILVGKTNAPELGLVPTTEPISYGPTHNPWDPTRSPGGSSGGSGAAVASGMVAVGHAGDGGGSIRIPASECGLVGLKPSRGRVSLGPDEAQPWDGFVSRGVVVRTVRDCARILDVIAGYVPGDPYTALPPSEPYADEVGSDPGHLRIGVLATVPNGMTEVEPECVDAVETTASVLESLGHHVEPSYPLPLAETEMPPRFSTMVGTFTARDLDDWALLAGRPVREEDVEPGTWLLAELGRAATASDYLAAKHWLEDWSRRTQEWWNEWDVLLTPTLPSPPPLLGEMAPGPDGPMRGMLKAASLVHFTAPFNVTGQPAISVPGHWNNEGLPIGIQLVAAYAREDVLIRVASQLEEALPWADRRPPIHA